MSDARLELLERLLERLRHYAATVTRARLESDLDAWLMVSRAMELAAQCCVDLSLVIVARRGLGVPETYRDAFSRLAQAGVVPAGLAQDLQGWAGLRNVLAHVYTTVDLDRLYAALTGELEALRAFGAIASRELEGEESG